MPDNSAASKLGFIIGHVLGTTAGTLAGVLRTGYQLLRYQRCPGCGAHDHDTYLRGTETSQEIGQAYRTPNGGLSKSWVPGCIVVQVVYTITTRELWLKCRHCSTGWLHVTHDTEIA